MLWSRRPHRPRSLPVHPSQVYAAGCALVVFLTMLSLKKARRFEGSLILVYFSMYCVVRFFLEFTRVNELAFWGLTVYQAISVPLAIMALLVYRFSGKRHPQQRKLQRHHAGT